MKRPSMKDRKCEHGNPGEVRWTIDAALCGKGGCLDLVMATMGYVPGPELLAKRLRAAPPEEAAPQAQEEK